MSHSDDASIDKVGTWNPPGRSPGWRVGMLVAAALSTSAGLALLLWPWLLIWLLSGVFFLVALFLALSALLARGGGAPSPVDLSRPYDAGRSDLIEHASEERSLDVDPVAGLLHDEARWPVHDRVVHLDIAADGHRVQEARVIRTGHVFLGQAPVGM